MKSNSFSNDLLINSDISDNDILLTKSTSLNFFMNNSEIPKFMSRNLKQLLKLRKNQQNSVNNDNIHKNFKIQSNLNENLKKTINSDHFIKPYPKVNNINIELKKFNSDSNVNGNHSNGFKTKINNFYGRENIELWEDEKNNKSNSFEKQISFINKEQFNNKSKEILKKDEYDIDYDKGKTKKIKKKKEFQNTNFFQKNQDNYEKYIKRRMNV